MVTELPESHIISRRAWLKRAAQLGLTAPLVAMSHRFAGATLLPPNELPPFPASAAEAFSAADDAFLEEMEKASFLFFWEQADSNTGLVKDRSPADGESRREIASAASVGFGLTALCIAEHRGWEARDKLMERARATLRFLARNAPHQRGFFYHWMDLETGKRREASEVSSIDTALLLCGVLTCRACYDDAEIRQLATQIYERVDWNWMRNGGATLAQGWRPLGGFLRARWDSYCELMMMYLLGLGSPSHALPAETWDAWSRPMFEYEGLRYVGSHAPLFVHQYSHAWFDFRGRRDRYTNYFENSVTATRAHKLWCLALANRFPDYGEDLWGITASDSPHGYVVWGGPPQMGPIDGSVVPAAAGGSLPFLPQETLRVLRTIRERYGQQAWKRYGFVDAFNPKTGWYARDVIGINVGITLLMAENARSGFVWDTFMKNTEAQRAMAQAGFH